MNNPQVNEYIACLKDADPDIRRRAANALGELGDPAAVPALIDALSDKSDFVRRKATLSLKKIGSPAASALATALQHKDVQVRQGSFDALIELAHPSAVPSLSEALKHKDRNVRWRAAYLLRKISSPSAIPALIEALKDKYDSGQPNRAAFYQFNFGPPSPWKESVNFRDEAADALGQIGDVSAVPVLIEMLKDTDGSVRSHCARALGEIGDSMTLPRKIVAYAQLPVRERINLLEMLRRIHCKRGHFNDMQRTLRYEFSDTRTLCQDILDEEDDEARKGAQSILNWLEGEQHLLHASRPDSDKQSHDLLRPVQGGEQEARPTTLVRAAEAPKEDKETVPPQPTVWHRLFGKRSRGSS